MTPHQLRHTFATQLVNVGCPITTIQSLMGHKRLSTTLVYAQVHSQTVAEDYHTAMRHIEQQAQPDEDPRLALEQTLKNATLTDEQRTLLQALLDSFSQP